MHREYFPVHIYNCFYFSDDDTSTSPLYTGLPTKYTNKAVTTIDRGSTIQIDNPAATGIKTTTTDNTATAK